MSAPVITPHRSRSLPLCVECIHFVTPSSRPALMLCGHPATPRSLIDGALQMTAAGMRCDGLHPLMEQASLCGSAGRLFVRRYGGSNAAQAGGDGLQGSADVLVKPVVPNLRGAGPDESANERGVGGCVALTKTGVDLGDGGIQPPGCGA